MEQKLTLSACKVLKQCLHAPPFAANKAEVRLLSPFLPLGCGRSLRNTTLAELMMYV